LAELKHDANAAAVPANAAAVPANAAAVPANAAAVPANAAAVLARDDMHFYGVDYEAIGFGESQVKPQ
jgi:hypothetical protein